MKRMKKRTGSFLWMNLAIFRRTAYQWENMTIN